METFQPLERVDAGRLLAEAERLVATGDFTNFENFVHTLEATRQHYVEIERQSTATVRQLEQEFSGLRGELAYNPAAVEQYRELQLALDVHLSRLQAGRKEAETLAAVLLKLRPELERFGGRRKAIDLAVRARELRKELHEIKQAFLPAFEQLVERIFALNRDAAAFNRMVSVAHLPQTQFLQCRVDLAQLLGAFAELDIIVTPEMEQLAATLQRSDPANENSMPRASRLEFLEPNTTEEGAA
jgi:hypothetical protein